MTHRSSGWPTSRVVHMTRQSFKHLSQRHTKRCPQRCHLHSDKGKALRSAYQCEERDVGFCACQCFKVHYWKFIESVKLSSFGTFLCVILSVVTLKTDNSATE
jgi:hypothetical protein